MGMTDSDFDHKVEKCLYFNDIALNEVSLQCSRSIVDYSNKTFVDLINRGQILDMILQRKVPRFCVGAIWNLHFQILFQPRSQQTQTICITFGQRQPTFV